MIQQAGSELVQGSKSINSFSSLFKQSVLLAAIAGVCCTYSIVFEWKTTCQFTSLSLYT
jgi:hypothetical protein